jgi:glycosyltransferase involved in cell wall biosynthesis
MTPSLTIFLPHCSDLLTDNLPHGDGLVANGFVRRLADRGHRLIVAVPEADLREPLPASVSLHVLGRTGGRGLLGRLIYMAKVRRLYSKVSRDVSIDLIHQLNPVYTGISLALVGRSSAPVLLGPYVARWPDDPDAIAFKSSSLRTLLSGFHAVLATWQQHFASILLLTTEAARDRLHEAAYDRTKARLLPHGLDTDFFTPKKNPTEISDGPGRKTILFLSNVHRRKGIFDLLLAFAKLAPNYADAHLCIAGAGDDLEAAKDLAAQFSVSSRIKFLGRQSREESVELLNRCTVFCLPSYGEPYGMAATEAMSCGKPVVATSTGGLGYLVDDSVGLRVPPGDVPALASAISSLLDSPSLCLSMGAAGRELMLKTVAWDRVIDQLESSYQEAIERRVSPQLALDEVSAKIQNCA